jgi:membrane protease YdiL (CAAX protease family)
MGGSGPTWPANVFYYIGGVMPPAAAIVVLYMHHSPDTQRDFWRRLVDGRRIGGRWYAATLLTVPALTGLAALLDIVLGGGGGTPEALLRFLPRPLAVVPFALSTLVVGPLPEELAWRGYGLDRLQERLSPVASSLVVGAVWTIWHIPLFGIAGTYQQGLGVGTQAFWLYLLDKVPQSVLMTWIYNNPQRSTQSAVLFHTMVNLVGELFELEPRAEVFYIALWYIVAGLVAALWGARDVEAIGRSRSQRKV